MSKIRATISIILALTMSFSIIGILPAWSAVPDRAPGQNLNVDAPYTVGVSETWDLVLVKAGGTLNVPSGATLNAKSVLLQGGAFLVHGGTVIITQTTPGADAVITGDCTEFNVSASGRLVLRAPDGDLTMDASQGGEAIVQINASSSVSVTGGSSISCIGGNGTSTDRPWTTAPLSGYVSAGGRGYISLGGLSTPRVEVSGGSQLVTVGMRGGNAADGKPGVGENGGQGGGFSNGGIVSGFVGSGGDGLVEIFGVTATIDDAIIQCTGGRGGDAGDGARGSPSGHGGSTYPDYLYSGGGGGGGYGGGNGGSDYQNAGKSGTATENVGTGGYAMFTVLSSTISLRRATVTLKGGDGGSPGNGGGGGNYPEYRYYSAGGGGGGFGGGGGGSSYASGGSGSATGNVGSGGEANMSVTGLDLTVDGLQLNATGGNSQKGGNGADATYGGGGGGGGYGGGGGAGGYSAGGSGTSSGNAGSGGNGTCILSATNLSFVNSAVALAGGNAGNGGTGARGGSNAGGGGGGYGGGGGDGYYNWNGGGGAGSCSLNVGRGGAAMSRFFAPHQWVNTSMFGLLGGRGGNGGTAGASGGQGGGGGGGYAGGGGGSYSSGSPTDGTAGARVGDGGDAQLEFYCDKGSIPLDYNTIDARGGTKGDGKTAKGGGLGGSGKGRPTSDGALNSNIPRLIPVSTGPADMSRWNNVMPTLSWLRQLDGVVFPGTSDLIQNYEVQIDNDSEFLTPDEDAKDVAPVDSNYLPVHLRGGHYFWRVRAVYEGAKSPGWSEVRQFELNGPPSIVKPLPSVSFAEDGALLHAMNLSEYFTDDLYPDELVFSVAYEQDATKVDAEIDGTWLNLYTGTVDWYGVKKVAVRATDRGGISAVSNNFTVTVTPVNDPPFFLGLPQVDVTEDQSYTFDLSPYVGDVDNTVEQLRIYFSSPYATVEGLNITFLYPRAAGGDRLNISLSDGMATVYGELSVNITAVDDTPVTVPIPALVTNEDTNISMDLTLFANDEEDLPSQLKWTASDVPTDLFSASIDERNVMRITPVADKSGEGSMLLTVRDTHGNEGTVNLTVRVQTVNDAPVISGVPNLTLKVNSVFKLDVTQYVQDMDNDRSELRVTVNSLYASVSGFVISFEYPEEEGLESDVVRILVSDGKAVGHQDISVTLKFPPMFGTPIGEITVEVGKEATVDLTRYVYDREDGPSGLKYAVTRVDKALIEVGVDSGGELKIKANKGRTGSNDIYLVVTDSDGNKANQTIHVVVTPAGSIFGSGEGTEVLMWVLPLAVVVAMVGAAGGMYFIALRRKRLLEVEQARDERKMLPTGEERMVTARGPGASGGQAVVPAGKVCFACGAKLVALGSGSFQCVKCGRTQK